MPRLVYLVAYPFLLLISYLPFRLLYVFSDSVFFLVYYIVGYRKKIVRKNLAITLPHLTDRERFVIEKKFYRHVCDMFLEMIKPAHITDAQMRDRYRFVNPEVVHNLEREGKSIALVTSHYANYEWLGSLTLHMENEVCIAYKKIANPFFDKYFRDIRSRFRPTLVTTKEMVSQFLRNAKAKKVANYLFIGDQTPGLSSAHYWHSFMGLEVPVHVGAETLAKRNNMAIVFLHTRKIKRGYYETTFDVITDNAKGAANYYFTDIYIELVEKQIREAPEYYFWTHRRWKFARNNGQ